MKTNYTAQRRLIAVILGVFGLLFVSGCGNVIVRKEKLPDADEQDVETVARWTDKVIEKDAAGNVISKENTHEENWAAVKATHAYKRDSIAHTAVGGNRMEGIGGHEANGVPNRSSSATMSGSSGFSGETTYSSSPGTNAQDDAATAAAKDAAFLRGRGGNGTGTGALGGFITTR